MKVFICVLVILQIALLTEAGMFSRVKSKLSKLGDKFLSRRPVDQCAQVVASMQAGKRVSVSPSCQCMLKNLETKLESSSLNIRDIIRNATRMFTHSKTLEKVVATLEDELVSAKEEVSSLAQHLEAVCPRDTAVRAACEENPAFTFVQTEDGCQSLCYYSDSTMVDYAGAEEMCETMGGRLIALDTIQKNALMVDAIREKSMDSSFWIGLKFSEDVWTWSNQMSAGFTDWATNEPDAKQDCVALNRAAEHRWYDWPCHTVNKNGAICEIVA